MSTDNDTIIDAITNIREDLHDYDETNRGRQIMSRPLPDAIDVLRYLDASRRLAITHTHSMAAGCKDWPIGTPAEQLLYRTPGIYGDAAGREYMDKRALVRDALRVVREHADETLWAATRIADTIERLDPVKDAADIAALAILRDELIDDAERLDFLLAMARNDKETKAALHAAIKAAMEARGIDPEKRSDDALLRATA